MLIRIRDDQRMKIALVCPASLPATQFGGIMFLCLDLARELSRIDNDVTIYTTDLDFANNAKTFNKKLPRMEKIGNFRINRSHVWFSIVLFYVNPGIYRQMMKDDPDIIHTIGIRSFQSFIAAIVSKRKNIPLVISDQGGLTKHPDFLQGGILKKILYTLQKPMIKFVINQSTKISVANEYEQQIFSQFNAGTKTEIIQNGINLSELDWGGINFKQSHNIKDRFILFLGRFNKVKGIDNLLLAMNLIKDREEMKNAKLVIMGVDFGFESEMLEMISKLDLTDKIIVIKRPKREEVIAAYRECEFLVLPSRWELSPLTPLEGFAFKKTVVSTNTDGIPFTVKNNTNAVLVEPENTHQLAEAMLDLLTNDKKRTDLGAAGYEQVQNICNSKIMASKTLGVYQRILSNR